MLGILNLNMNMNFFETKSAILAFIKSDGNSSTTILTFKKPDGDSNSHFKKLSIMLIMIIVCHIKNKAIMTNISKFGKTIPSISLLSREMVEIMIKN